MSGKLEPGMRICLYTPERGYRYAQLVEQCGLQWLVELSSGYQFYLYEDQFDLEY
jgi:hypothetical protein